MYTYLSMYICTLKRTSAHAHQVEHLKHIVKDKAWQGLLCIYLCMNIYTHKHTLTHTHTHIHAHIRWRIWKTKAFVKDKALQDLLCIYLCINIYEYVYTHKHTLSHTHTHIHAHIRWSIWKTWSKRGRGKACCLLPTAPPPLLLNPHAASPCNRKVVRHTTQKRPICWTKET